MPAPLRPLEAADSFVARHIGPSEGDISAMLHEVGAATLDDLVVKTVPPVIRTDHALDLPPPIDEAAVMAELRELAAKNVMKKSLIGMGYHGTHTPPVIQRNVLENPACTRRSHHIRRRLRRVGWRRCLTSRP